MSGTKEAPSNSSSSKAVPKVHLSGAIHTKTSSGSPIKGSERDKSPHKLSPRGKLDTAEKGFSSMRLSPSVSSKKLENNRKLSRDASDLHLIAAEVSQLS